MEARRRITALSAVLVALLWASSATLADTGFEWSLDRDEIALGEPVMLTLERALSVPGPGLEAFDATILEPDFEVYGRMRGRRADLETLVLELYPLRTGELRLPLPGTEAKPPLRVQDRGPGTLRVSFRIFSEPETWRVRQPMRLVLEACVRGTVVWQQPDPGFVTGLAIHSLGRISPTGVRDGRDCVPEQWAWSLTPTTGGQYQIEFGMLEGNRFGQRLRFPLPSLRAAVEGEPDWLPAGIAQSEPRLEFLSVPEHARPGQPLSVHLRIQADYSESVLIGLLRAQLAGDANWSRYPPDLQRLANEGIIPRWEIHLHAQPDHPGALRLPALRLPWFDPGTDALQHLILDTPEIRVEAKRPGWVWAVGGALLLGALLALVARAAMIAWVWRAQRRALLRRVRASNSFAELHRALVATPPQPGQRGLRSNDALPLEQWARDFSRHWHAPNLMNLAARLNAARFGKTAETNCAEQRDALLDCLVRATPCGRWPILFKAAGRSVSRSPAATPVSDRGT